MAWMLYRVGSIVVLCPGHRVPFVLLDGEQEWKYTLVRCSE